MKPNFVVEHWPHGLAVCPAPGTSGVPITAMTQCLSFSPKGAVLDSGIQHHLEVTRKSKAIFVIVSPKGAKEWRSEIEQEIAGLPPEEKWWKGLDVGLSSAAIFGALCSNPMLKMEALAYCKGATPRDVSDLGRCQRLLELMPEWKQRLGEVGSTFRDSKWGALVSVWSKLEAGTTEQQTVMLRELEETRKA